MSNFDKPKRLDEKAIAILTDFFLNKHGDKFDLQFHGIKDNTPDTDGFLRLRKSISEQSWSGEYLDQVVFFQLKGQEKPINNRTFQNSNKKAKKLVDFCKSINLPTILFIVSNIGKDEFQKNAQIFWYHFSNINVEILDDENKKRSSSIRIPNLEVLKDGEIDNSDTLYLFLKYLAARNHFQDLPKEFLNVVINYKENAIKLISVIYLLGKVNQTNEREVRRIINLQKREYDNIIANLQNEDLVYRDRNTVIFKQVPDEFNRNIGNLLLHEAVGKLPLDELVAVFNSPEQTRNIYKNLADVGHPRVKAFLEKTSSNMLENV